MLALLLNLHSTPLGQLMPKLTKPVAGGGRTPPNGGADVFEALTCEAESQGLSISLIEGAEPGLQVDAAVDLSYGVAAQLSGQAGIIGSGNDTVEAYHLDATLTIGCVVHDVLDTAAATSGDEVTTAINGLASAMVNEQGGWQNVALQTVTPIAGPGLADRVLQAVLTAVGVAVDEPAYGIERASAYE